ncbi:MAG: hypothetical protein HUU16_13245 [Candidatus Omnitrophica bacterium]|nr:hypothetical protein [bacterium]NUN97130.1 hypothetical protein [Candidatus Omnitrophota bacterium]
MRKMKRVHGMGILLLLATAFLMTGCCMRLQSPVVFDSCGCNWSCVDNCGGCGNCNSCCPAPCDPSYR